MTILNEDLTTFATNLQQEVYAQAESDDDGQFREEVFTQRMIEFLEDFGEVDDATVCQYQRRGMKIDGYCVGQDEQTLDLIVAHCEWANPPATVGKSTLTQVARQGRG